MDNIPHSVESIRKRLSQARDKKQICDIATLLLREIFPADRVLCVFNENSDFEFAQVGESLLKQGDALSWFRIRDGSLYYKNIPIELPLLLHDIARATITKELHDELHASEARSFCLYPISQGETLKGWLELHCRRGYHRWRKEDIFILDVIATYLALFMERFTLAGKVPDDQVGTRQQFQRVLSYGNLIIVRTNEAGIVTDVIGDTEPIFGVKPGELLSDLGVWSRFVPRKDLRTLMKALRRAQNLKTEVSEEIRIINEKNGALRWLLMRGIPLFTPEGVCLGWEGYGVDITERHTIQDELTMQRRRLEALYDIARSLHVALDPSTILLRGLQALLRAMNADAGFSGVIHPTTGEIELVAADGFDSEELEKLQEQLKGDNIASTVIGARRAIFYDDIHEDQSAPLKKLPFVRSCALAPLIVDSTVRGVIGVFSRKENRFYERDGNLLSVAATQIASILEHAESYADERRQSDALAFLYKLTHTLGQHQTPREIAEHAFPILQEEIPCRRMWLGVLNEQGTHIVGQAGFGPGIRRQIVNIQIELDLQHDFLDDALKQKQPVIMRPNSAIECSGLNRIIQKLQPQTLVILPLVALGQVVGLLVLEPNISSPLFIQRRLPLLTSVGNELGSVILARRFEAKIADADKMRMASLFASGVAHNFNNMLQAIMGQASLIEIQTPETSPVIKSAKLINDAASKGAALIAQLLSFATTSGFDRKHFQVDKMVSDSTELYRSILGDEISFEVSLEDKEGEIYGDAGQVQRVITNLLVNAKEALSNRVGGAVKIVVSHVRLRSGEIDPELAPGMYVRIDVTDNGPGMDAERLARCFEPFYTTKNYDTASGIGYAGSGLGLSTAYSIIKQHEGLITARSSAGQGAVFSVYLPFGKQIGEAAAPEVTHPDILLYGLELLPSGSLKTSLEEYGVTCAFTQSRDEVLEFSRKTRDASALLLIDADKENVRLTELIRSVRQDNPTLKIILSCFDGKRWSGVIRALGQLPDVEVVEKTLGVWALQTTVRRMLGLKAKSKLVVEKEDDESKVKNGHPGAGKKKAVTGVRQ